METMVVGVLVGVWLLVMLTAVLAPWVADPRRTSGPAPAVRPFPPSAREAGEDAARPAA